MLNESLSGLGVDLIPIDLWLASLGRGWRGFSRGLRKRRCRAEHKNHYRETVESGLPA